MRKFSQIIGLLLVLGACGYHNPYITNSNSKPISLNRSLWINKTGETGLENTMYQSLSNWLRKSGLIHLTADPAAADYVLTGSIDSVDFPELSYGSHQVANELRANLHVSFAVTERASGHKVWEVSKLFTETLDTSSNPTTLQANKKKALSLISDDISEMIYLHIINTIMRPATD